MRAVHRFVGLWLSATACQPIAPDASDADTADDISGGTDDAVVDETGDSAPAPETGDSGTGRETGDSGTPETGDTGTAETGDSASADTGDSGGADTGDSADTDLDTAAIDTGDSGGVDTDDTVTVDTDDTGLVVDTAPACDLPDLSDPYLFAAAPEGLQTLQVALSTWDDPTDRFVLPSLPDGCLLSVQTSAGLASMVVDVGTPHVFDAGGAPLDVVVALDGGAPGLAVLGTVDVVAAADTTCALVDVTFDVWCGATFCADTPLDDAAEAAEDDVPVAAVTLPDFGATLRTGQVGASFDGTEITHDVGDPWAFSVASGCRLTATLDGDHDDLYAAIDEVDPATGTVLAELGTLATRDVVSDAAWVVDGSAGGVRTYRLTPQVPDGALACASYVLGVEQACWGECALSDPWPEATDATTEASFPLLAALGGVEPSGVGRHTQDATDLLVTPGCTVHLTAPPVDDVRYGAVLYRKGDLSIVAAADATSLDLDIPVSTVNGGRPWIELTADLLSDEPGCTTAEIDVEVTCPPVRGQGTLRYGDLVINELERGGAPNCGSGTSQLLELRNLSDDALDIEQVVIAERQQTWPLPRLIVAPGDVVLFGRGPFLDCHGVNYDATIRPYTNPKDFVSIFDPPYVLDAVGWQEWGNGFFDDGRHSWQRDPEDPWQWCKATEVGPSGWANSPQRQNEDCGPTDVDWRDRDADGCVDDVFDPNDADVPYVVPIDETTRALQAHDLHHSAEEVLQFRVDSGCTLTVDLTLQGQAEVSLGEDSVSYAFGTTDLAGGDLSLSFENVVGVEKVATLVVPSLMVDDGQGGAAPVPVDACTPYDLEASLVCDQLTSCPGSTPGVARSTGLAMDGDTYASGPVAVGTAAGAGGYRSDFLFDLPAGCTLSWRVDSDLLAYPYSYVYGEFPATDPREWGSFTNTTGVDIVDELLLVALVGSDPSCVPFELEAEIACP